MSYLLDTNVISEFVRPKPDPRVVAWLRRTDESSLHLSVLVLGELRKGIDKLPPSPRRASLERWITGELPVRFRGRLISVSEQVADMWGKISARAESTGKALPVIDALIAATGIVSGLTIVTRNSADMVRTGVQVFDPWQS